MARQQGKKATARQLRVGEELRHALAAVLEREDLREPALRGCSITVNEVRISADLRNATAYVMPLGGTTGAVSGASPGASSEEFLAALNHLVPFFRSRIARMVRLRYVPQLRFRLDEAMEYASRIEGLLRRPEVARDLGPAPTAEGESSESQDESP